jgi:hypothetical protein
MTGPGFGTELRQTGRLLKLERIPLQLLFLLAENRDRLVTREEILQAGVRMCLLTPTTASTRRFERRARL